MPRQFIGRSRDHSHQSLQPECHSGRSHHPTDCRNQLHFFDRPTHRFFQRSSDCKSRLRHHSIHNFQWWKLCRVWRRNRSTSNTAILDTAQGYLKLNLLTQKFSSLIAGTVAGENFGYNPNNQITLNPTYFQAIPPGLQAINLATNSVYTFTGTLDSEWIFGRNRFFRRTLRWFRMKIPAPIPDQHEGCSVHVAHFLRANDGLQPRIHELHWP